MGLRFRPADTFCTRLCENESNLKVIQDIMGHADIKTTMDIDDQDLLFARREFVTYRMAHEYYGLGEKPTIRMAWASGAVFKIGKTYWTRYSCGRNEKICRGFLGKLLIG